MVLAGHGEKVPEPFRWKRVLGWATLTSIALGAIIYLLTKDLTMALWMGACPLVLARMNHRFPAASADSTAFTARNTHASFHSVSTRFHRGVAISSPTCSTLHALATKMCDSCGLVGVPLGISLANAVATIPLMLLTSKLLASKATREETGTADNASGGDHEDGLWLT